MFNSADVAPEHLAARKGTNMKRGLDTTSCAVFFAALFLVASPALASETASVGGTAGTQNYSRFCASGSRVTGVQVTYGDVIDRIQFRCTPINASGDWGSTNHTWTTFTPSNNPFPATNSANRTCSTNRFVGAFRGYTKNIITGQTVISRVDLACYEADASGKRVGSAADLTSVGGSTSGGSWSAWRACPSDGLANGASGRSGFHLDNMRLTCADPVPPAPQLTQPAEGAMVTANIYSFAWTAVTGATRYEICITTTGQCPQATASVTGTTWNMPETVHNQYKNTYSIWAVRACNQSACGQWSQGRHIRVALPAAVLSSPANNATAANRRPTFGWQSVTGAQRYQLYLSRSGITDSFFTSGAQTQLTPNRDINTQLQNPVYWQALACSTIQGQEVCGAAFKTEQIRGINLPPPPAAFNFSTQLAPTFRHVRCSNCHAVAADNFARDTATDQSRGLPQNHTVVTASTNCASCHTSTLLPAAGNINPGWQAAPSTMDFRNRTDSQLCTMARNPGSHATTAFNHLTQDKLVLWAVGDGRRPQNATPYPTAPPYSIAAWQSLIQSWVNAGMPCP